MNTSLGLNENIEGALCYSILFISGIVLLVLEQQNKFVRFHAIQSIAIFFPLFIITQIVNAIPGIGSVLGGILGLLTIVLWAFLIFKAIKGETYKFPIVGEYAERQVK